VALAFVWEEQSEGDCEILRSDKEVCGRVKSFAEYIATFIL
jgi:hypothetical protein